MTYPSAAFAREFVVALAAHGVVDVVLCPGSRSGPLAHALAQAGSQEPPPGAPHINLHVRIDERSAAFLALGMARARKLEGEPRPVVVVTTSGTAVGNLLPAVMEAHHSGIPLLLVSADRPSELRGVGANQTTDQEGIFGQFVRWETNSAAPREGERGGRAAQLVARAVHWAMGGSERDDTAAAVGPVHLNLEFREPLGYDGGQWSTVDPEKATLLDRARGRLGGVALASRTLPDVERGIVIAGDGAGDVARQVAQAHGWPLLAEPTSGARSGSHAITGYVALLGTSAGQDLANSAEQVVLIGRPTLSRPISRLVEASRALYVAAHGARWREAPAHAQRVLPAVPHEWLQPSPRIADSEAGAVTPDWLAKWRALAPAAEVSQGWGPHQIAAGFLAALSGGEVAVLGSSGPIRAADAVAPAWEPGEAPTLLANRGLAGIDGTVSTAMGVALALGTPVHALMGDVTFVHDAGGLLVGTEEVRPDVRIVVANDGGGTIFGKLEHASAPEDIVRRVFTTPHGADLAALAAAYGARHVRVEDQAGLARALAAPIHGVEVIEAVLPQG